MARNLGVQYVYEQDEKHKAIDEAESLRGTLTTKALAQLPNELRRELKQAIIDLDVDLIEDIIGRIRELNGPVADGLAELAKDFQYEKLLALIWNREQWPLKIVDWRMQIEDARIVEEYNKSEG